jgi:hypothetical protein
VRDTPKAGQARYEELLEALSPEQRLGTVMRLNRTVRELALAGIDQAYPSASSRQRDALLAERLYGRAVAERLYGAALDEIR